MVAERGRPAAVPTAAYVRVSAAVPRATTAAVAAAAAAVVVPTARHGTQESQAGVPRSGGPRHASGAVRRRAQRTPGPVVVLAARRRQRSVSTILRGRY